MTVVLVGAGSLARGFEFPVSERATRAIATRIMTTGNAQIKARRVGELCGVDKKTSAVVRGTFQQQDFAAIRTSPVAGPLRAYEREHPRSIAQTQTGPISPTSLTH